MEPLINNPGYQHIVEDIFLNLDQKEILQCRLVNKSWKKHIDQSIFWLKKCSQSQKQQQEKSSNQDSSLSIWTSIVQALKEEFENHLLTSSQTGSPTADRNHHHLEQNIVQCLMKLNNLLDQQYQYPLHMVSKIGDVKLVQFILENVNSPMYDQHGRTPIHFAALNGHSEVVKIIINFTEIPNVADLYGMTPIHLATKNGHANVVQVLTPCSSWNLLDFNGTTPIHVAAQLNRVEILKILVNWTEHVNATDHNGWSPMHEAVINGHTEIVKLLIKYTNYPN